MYLSCFQNIFKFRSQAEISINRFNEQIIGSKILKF